MTEVIDATDVRWRAAHTDACDPHAAAASFARTHARARSAFAFAAVAGALIVMLCAVFAADAGATRTVARIDGAPLFVAPGLPMARPDGRSVRESGSAWVLRRRGGWLQIPTLLRRGSLRGWIRSADVRELHTTRLLVRVDLSERRVRVTAGARLLMSVPVGVGASGSPSPIGATSVSEFIPVTPRSIYSAQVYGPMIVALRLWQIKPSPAFPFGGLMAFHGGDERGIGAASSSGCFRMRNADVGRFAALVREGTPVIIRP